MKILQISILFATFIFCESLIARAVDVKTLAIVGDQELPKRYIKVTDGYAELSFSAIQPSELVRALADDGTLPLFELIENPDGPLTYKMAEEINLPAGASGVLLIGWKSEEIHRYLAIDSALLSEKPNEWLLVNTGTKSVDLQIGSDEKSVIIDTNTAINHKVNAIEGTGIAVVAKAQVGEKLKTFYSTYWAIRPEDKGLVVIFYEKGDRMAVKKTTNILIKPKDDALN